MQQTLILCESTLLSALTEYSESNYLVSTLKEHISTDNVQFCILHKIKEEWIKGEEILYLSTFTFDIRFKNFLI